MRVADPRTAALARIEAAKKTNSHYLDLSALEMKTIPYELFHLTGLQILNLSRNRLPVLPAQIGHLPALTNLSLAENQLEALPAEIAGLSVLTNLSLADNQLATLPAEIGKLTALTALDLSRNLLTALPVDIGRLTALTTLDASRNSLAALPREIGRLTNLSTLDLAFNQLVTLPGEIKRLTALTTLNLSHNKLTALPGEIGGLTALQTLFLGDNKLTALPGEIGGLTALQFLGLSRNQLMALPVEIGRLSVLSELQLQSNQLEALPSEIGQLTVLTILALNDNWLAALPAEVGQLTALKKLFLRGNRLAVLPTKISRLTALRELHLSDNKLAVLPVEIGRLSALSDLDLSGNQLPALPAEIGQLTALTGLELSRNQLPALPSEIGQLTALTVLDLSRNRLAALPSEIGQLSALTKLDLLSNQLNAVPGEIGRLTSLKQLRLEGNPLPEPLIAASQRGTLELLAYLRSLAEGARKLYEAKLVLVGEGNVGKSSLLSALCGEPFLDERETTHGIDIKPLVVHHPSLPEAITLKAWDFGGQTVYRVTHQFFFSKRSLYLVVWWPREGADKNDVEGWIRRIKLRVGDEARILVVATHCGPDQRLARIDEAGLRKLFGDSVIGFHEVDSKTGFGIAGLREAIAAVAAKLPQMGEPFNDNWKAARDEVCNIEKPRLAYAEFAAVCEHHGLDDLATRTLADLMSDLGYIIYFNDDSLRDFIVRRPDWLTKAISYVLEDLPTNQAAGVLDHDRLRKIWYDHGNPNYERYDPQLHPYFLRLMEKFDVSYRTDDGTKSLVGQLVPIEGPPLPWTPTAALDPKVSQLRLVCRIREEPPGLIPWLIVRNHRFSTKRHWQTGMFLADDDYGSALLELLDRELTITVRSAYPGHFLDVLSDGVKYLIQQRWRGLDYEMAVPCTGYQDGRPCRGRFGLAALRDFKRDGDETIRCQDCRTKQSLETLLTGFEPRGIDFHQEFEQLHVQLGKAAENQERHALQAAQMLRVLLQALTSETRECPRLFTLLPEDGHPWNPLHWFQTTYRLTLWCEMPNCVHSTDLLGDGSGHYALPRTKDWAAKLLRLAAYGSLIVTALRILVPVMGPVAAIGLDEKRLQEAAEKLDLMAKVTDAILKNDGKVGLETQWRGTAEGAGLRELHSLLLEIDPARTWGGLRRVLAPTGDYLWLCPTHYKVYEPDLPKL